MRIDLANVPQRQVQLVLILPARRLDPFHEIDQRVANGDGRANADEQAVGHGKANRSVDAAL